MEGSGEERGAPVDEARMKFGTAARRARCGWIRKSGKPVAQVTREPGIEECTLGRHSQDARPDPAGDGG